MKIVLTGIVQGIGRYLIHQLKEKEGAYIIGIDKEPYSALPPEVQSFTDEYHQTDLSKTEETEKLLTDIIRDHPSLDLIINNAGLKTFNPVTSISTSDIIDTITVNTITPILFIQRMFAAYDRLKIINIGSNSGFQAGPNTALYGASKSALINLNEGIAKTLGARQKMYTICPSIVATTEYIREYPENKNKVRQPADIYKIIKKIIQDKEKRIIIPVITFREKIFYIIKGIIQTLRWYL